jgi:hypothetical protein
MQVSVTAQVTALGKPELELLTVRGVMTRRDELPRYSYPYSSTLLIMRMITVKSRSGCPAAWPCVHGHRVPTCVHYTSLLMHAICKVLPAIPSKGAITFSQTETGCRIWMVCSYTLLKQPAPVACHACGCFPDSHSSGHVWQGLVQFSFGLHHLALCQKALHRQ